MISQEDIKLIAQNPKDYLLRGFRIERRIQIKLQRIKRLQQVSIQITSSMKGAPAYTGPSDKIGNCVIEILSLTEEINDDVSEMVLQQRNIGEAIRLFVSDVTARSVLEARYLAGLSWEEIAYNMHYAYRWVLRLHKRGLAMMKEAATNEM